MTAPEPVSLGARARPQYHYFYGSMDTNGGGGTGAATSTAASEGTAEQQEQESLIGEELVPTDHELDTPNSSEQDLQHMIITNGRRAAGGLKPWIFGGGGGGNQSAGRGSSSAFNNSLGRLVAIILLAIGMSALLIIWFPHTSQPLPTSQAIFIPFPSVDRTDYGDPVEGFINVDLFHPTLRSDTADSRTFVFAFPTGAFWTNLVVPPPTEILSYPIAVYPYAYKWSDSTLQLSYPSSHRVTTDRSIQDPFAPDLTFSTKEDIAERHVIKFDPLSVTLRFSATEQSKWESVLVQGSPYVTLKYLSATPVIHALSIFKSVQCPGDDDENFTDMFDDNTDIDGSDSSSGGGRRKLFGVCSIDDSNREKTILRGVQFILKTQEGMNWIVFASEPVTLSYNAITKTTVSAEKQFTGIIRLALVPPAASSDDDDAVQVGSSTGLRRLIYHAGVYPVGGDVSWDFRTTSSSSSSSSAKKTDTTTSATMTTSTSTADGVATVHFNYATRTMTDNSLQPNPELLMLVLPHHAQLLSKGRRLTGKHFDIEYTCIKGRLFPVVGSSVGYDEPLPDIGFDGPLQGWDPSVKTKILKQVDDDLDRLLPTRSENIYGFGKQVARLAQLTHIISQLAEDNNSTKSKNSSSTTNDGSPLFQKAHDLLWHYLEMMLDGEIGDTLLYDSNMGGIVSTNGLYDKGEDFGNGRYNDHHFHYGYILYASAIMAKVNSTFMESYGSHVDALFYDIAHRSSGDSRIIPSNSLFFPFARHKSWFDGHSFATGMFAFGNGKSQESSSEAVNCYYGAYLWSLVRHQETSASDLTDYTRLLLAMEIRGAKTYWQMMPPVIKSTNHSLTTKSKRTTDRIQVYSSKFESNYMVGNVGMLDVTCNTWFGSDPLYIHMINAIPITAATALLFDNNYVSQEYPYLMQSRSSVEMAWRGYTTSIHAIIDPAAAWATAQGIVSYELDSAISKSQVLYWISNRPGFQISDDDSSSSSSESSGGDSSPSDVPKTASGGKSSDKSNGSSLSASCESYPNCQALGLTGLCCPTLEGSFLGCCSQ